MMRLLPFSLLIIIILSFSFCNGQVSPRQHVNMDKGWKFHFGNASDPDKDFNYSTKTIFSKSGNGGGTAIDPRFNDSSWRTLDVPHDWAVELPFTNVKNFDVMAHGYKPVGGLFPATSIAKAFFQTLF